MKDLPIPDAIQYFVSFAFFIIYLWNEWQKRKRVKKISSDPEDLSKTLIADGRIYSVLVDMLIRFRAKRVYVVQFHNGEKFYSGQSIQRMSMTHEVKDPLLESIKKSYISIHLDAEMNEIVQYTIKYGGYSIGNIEEVQKSAFREMLSYRKVKSIYIWAIRNKKRQPVGLLYLTFPIIHGLNDTDFPAILLKMNEIENILGEL